MRDIISIRGDRKVFDEFVITTKLQKEKVWDILLQAIEQYIVKNRKMKVKK